MENLKAVPLWQWGLIVIIAGAASSGFMPPAHNSAEALGRGTAQVLFYAAGLVLIVMYFVRHKRNSVS